jgi:hypothetical protein
MATLSRTRRGRQGPYAAITRLLWVLALALPTAPVAAQSVMSATPIALDPDDETRTRVGSLDFLAGFVLHRKDDRFRELSGLAIDAAGRTLLAVTDEGDRVRIPLFHGPDGRITGFGYATLGPLPGDDGRPLDGRDGGAEGLTPYGTGFAVSFEDPNRVALYPDGLDAPSRILAGPAALGRMPTNQGLEGIAGLPDGSLVGLVEGERGPGEHAGVLVAPDGSLARFVYRTEEDFKPTDIALLPDGSLLVLERRFQASNPLGIAARLIRLAREAIAPGAVVEGREEAFFALPLSIDNFEGLAAREGPGGATLLYIVSDDNFNPLQRTILLQFRLNAPGG